ncbi:hypothetical protein CDCA_CDCA15G3983 [Cyanidium caldarium]|uniref:MIR domain-containing protein n=1 Tax=Cyanidium caldarium TaxID=2771 RepID=A0AAV9J045_CYACA|nr:hypothetical protein CDCA_CDCA15G3983 [Cyanidium caldarium]
MLMGLSCTTRRRALHVCCLVCILAIALRSSTAFASASPANASVSPAVEVGFELVTYTSVVKLEHALTGYRLYSMEVPYGSGSQQQAVTAFPHGRDDHTLWRVKEAHHVVDAASSAGGAMADALPWRAVRCQDTIRLEHARTRKNLHSHLMSSPLSGQQEVSAFAHDVDGRGDSGDNWVVECVDTQATHWDRGSAIRLRHVDTSSSSSSSGSTYLTTAMQYAYAHPIDGHLEVSAVKVRNNRAVASNEALSWRATEGFFRAAEK